MAKPEKEQFWTLPNIISLYRIIIFPFILYLLLVKREHLFSVFITISLFTDILDGLIARLFKLQTEIGARLDSWADTGTYILAFLGIYLFKWEELKHHLLPFYAFLFVMILSYVVVFVKFRGLIGMHTYLFKITGYLQGAFIVLLFNAGFYPWFYYVAIYFGVAACIEEIIIILLLRVPQTNVKGLYWLIREKKL